MPTFTAEEKTDVAAEARPGHGSVPQADPENMGFTGQGGTTLHKTFTYVTRDHGLSDIVKPGYFDTVKDYGLVKWDIITVTYGDDPGTACEVDLRVIDMPREKEKPVLVAKGPVRSFVPVRHDGTAVDDETPKGRKAA